METAFEVKVKQLIEKLPPEVRSRPKKYVEELINKGVDSVESLCSIVQDVQLDAELRLTASWLLGQLGDESAVPVLLLALNDPSPQIAWEASKSLGLLRSSKAVQPLMVVLLKGKSPNQRGAAAYGLGVLSENQAIEPLLVTLTNLHEDSNVRSHAAEALSNFLDSRIPPVLVNMLRDSSDKVRFSAAYALGEVGDWQAIPDLERLATTDDTVLLNQGTVSDAAIHAIENIRKRQEAK